MDDTLATLHGGLLEFVHQPRAGLLLVPCIVTVPSTIRREPVTGEKRKVVPAGTVRLLPVGTKVIPSTS